MQHTEEPFPRDHPLKGEMQENNLRQRLDPQPQPQLYKQGEEDEEQLLKHHSSSHQLSEHHAHHVQEISKHPHVTADSSAGRGDGFRQMTGRERISINKDLIGTPSNFQHIGHINREITSTQTTEEVRNLFQMVNLYQEQVGLLPGKATDEEPVEFSGSEGVNQQVDIPLAGDRGLADTEREASGVTRRQSPVFDGALDHDHIDCVVELRKERHGIPSASKYRAAYNFEQQRQTQTPQQTGQAILHDRVRVQDAFGEEDRKVKKNTRKSYPPRLLGSSSSLTREGKLRKEMIGSPKDFQHVMGAGHMLESHEKKSPLATSHSKKEETEGGGAKDPTHDRVPHISAVIGRKDMIGPPTDFHHVMGAGQMRAAHEIPPTHTPPNTITSDAEGREEQKELPYYRRPQPSAPPPPPPSALPPSSARIKGGRLRKDMIGAPTNFHHVMGTAPYHASLEGPITEGDGAEKSSLEERVAVSARLGQESSDLTKPIRKKSAIGHPTNFQHVVHVDTSTPESDLKQLLLEKTSDASMHGSPDVSKGFPRPGGPAKGPQGRGGPQRHPPLPMSR
ncbi:uncharacterized protein LOC119572250 isoform X1 [Penaeus monodon]|uniref:uncharacterized protein LOC119572250 isoform X1 n=1 Tax=Penaeus monodon TaxID=6687 RepID=UPI0018A7296E|nr:uncharacterized protein LOC119572250 isoform X1 [Penaeus monodon]XP_037775177.1 uncharacterized protein LOC119572250 isoform X1 [Penaeus monodon]XP_037775178.1 uncharacterized protein LOC119572250 isoform X1 [Penaeus monodon]